MQDCWTLRIFKILLKIYYKFVKKLIFGCEIAVLGILNLKILIINKNRRYSVKALNKLYVFTKNIMEYAVSKTFFKI